MNEHESYQELISQYVDQELPSNEGESMFRHLSDCKECRDFLSQSLQLRRMVLRERPPEPIVPMNARILSSTPASLHKRTSIPRLRQKISLSVAAIVTMILVVMGATAVISNMVSGDAGGKKTRSEVVYIMSLPVVEVEGSYLKSSLERSEQ